jgi:hypothetical protein
MITTQKPVAPATAQAKAKLVIPAEMVNGTGIKAVFAFDGVLFMTLAPDTAEEARTYNAAINKMGEL